MTPIQPSIFSGLTAAPSGAPPAVASDTLSFADLLPAVLRPVQPRKGDAGDGKDLPATPIEDEAEDATAWLVPPVLPAICPPLTVAASEVGSVSSSITLNPVVPSLTQHPASLSSSIEEEGSGTPAHGRDNEVVATPESRVLITKPTAGLVPPDLASFLRASEGGAPMVAAPRVLPDPVSEQPATTLVAAPPVTGANLTTAGAATAPIVTARLVPPTFANLMHASEGRTPVFTAQWTEPGAQSEQPAAAVVMMPPLARDNVATADAVSAPIFTASLVPPILANLLHASERRAPVIAAPRVQPGVPGNPPAGAMNIALPDVRANVVAAGAAITPIVTASSVSPMLANLLQASEALATMIKAPLTKPSEQPKADFGAAPPVSRANPVTAGTAVAPIVKAPLVPPTFAPLLRVGEGQAPVIGTAPLKAVAQSDQPAAAIVTAPPGSRVDVVTAGAAAAPTVIASLASPTFTPFLHVGEGQAPVIAAPPLKAVVQNDQPAATILTTPSGAPAKVVAAGAATAPIATASPVSPTLANLLHANEGSALATAAPLIQPVVPGDQSITAIVTPPPGVRLADGITAGGVTVATTTTAALTTASDATTALRSETGGIISPPAEQTPVASTTRMPIVADLPVLAAPRIAPAGEVFAAAIRQAVREERRAPIPDGTTLVAPATTGSVTPAVAAADTARQPTLDMHRETWPTKMIEHIAALRDAADANDTSIRLIPDRLGAIDVSLKREGDRVEVNLHAHQPETRALLAEAQPKLVEMGEARGLRLSTQADNAGSGAQHHQQQRAPTPSTPAPAPRRPAAASADSPDQRLA